MSEREKIMRENLKKSQLEVENTREHEQELVRELAKLRKSVTSQVSQERNNYLADRRKMEMELNKKIEAAEERADNLFKELERQRQHFTNQYQSQEELSVLSEHEAV